MFRVFPSRSALTTRSQPAPKGGPRRNPDGWRPGSDRAWQSSGRGPALAFFAGALASHDLWRDVIATLSGRFRVIGQFRQPECIDGSAGV